MSKTLHDRLWAVIAHVPIITIIWMGYLLCCKFLYECEVTTLLEKYQALDWHVLPITPMMMTLLSVPIAVGIQRMQRAYPLARNNAHEAYLFNIWLLQWYGIALLIAVCGLYFQMMSIVLFAAAFGFLAGINCLVQALIGIRVAWKGKVYRYWRLWAK